MKVSETHRLDFNDGSTVATKLKLFDTTIDVVTSSAIPNDTAIFVKGNNNIFSDCTFTIDTEINTHTHSAGYNTVYSQAGTAMPQSTTWSAPISPRKQILDIDIYEDGGIDISPGYYGFGKRELDHSIETKVRAIRHLAKSIAVDVESDIALFNEVTSKRINKAILKELELICTSAEKKEELRTKFQEIDNFEE